MEKVRFRFPKPKVTGSSPVGTAIWFFRSHLFNDLACGLCTEGGRVCNIGVLILAPQLLGHAAGSEPFLICGVGVTLDLRQRSRSRWRRSRDRFGGRELLIEAIETAPVG